jgi:hypothetical protein
LINNRQAGRRRGRGGNNNGGGQGGGGQRQGRSDNGNRIDNRARGNAAQLLEKYKNLASDAQRQGDRVATETYLQFADHYFRVIADQRGRFDDQPQRRQRDEFDNDGDDDFADEGEPIRAGEQPMEARTERQDRQAQDRQGNERQGSDRQGNDRQGQERFERQERGDRQDRPERQERAERQDRPERAPRQDRADRQDNPGRDRDEQVPQAAQGERFERRPRRDDRPTAEIGGQHRADAIETGEPLDARAEQVLDADAPLAAPARRRGRPRRDAGEVVEQVASFDADRLPPSLMAPVSGNDGESEGEAPKPRRRGRPPRVAAEAPAAE